MKQTVNVALVGREYPIHIGPGVKSLLPGLIGQLSGVEKVSIIADQRVADLHLDALLSVCPGKPCVQTFEPGEPSKSLETFGRLLDGLAQARIERSDLVITLGGGIAGDLGGFVAACWLRGIRFIQVPTTIEAAVDASVGGKTAVNHATGKNLVGAFHQPSAVVIDTDFLKTLDERDFLAGLGESVKHAAIRDPEFLDWHEANADAISQRDETVVAELVARNCAIKASVVARDEREHGLRAILNYGHTIGHAVELLMKYELRHGECVSIGMVAVNALAMQRGLMSAELAARIEALLVKLGLPVRIPKRLPTEEVLEACRMDKKNREGRINFVLVTTLGQTTRLDDFSDEEILAAIEAIQPV